MNTELKIFLVIVVIIYSFIGYRIYRKVTKIPKSGRVILLTKILKQKNAVNKPQAQKTSLESILMGIITSYFPPIITKWG